MRAAEIRKVSRWSRLLCLMSAFVVCVASGLVAAPAAYASGIVTSIVVSQAGYSAADYKIAHVIADGPLADTTFAIYDGASSVGSGTLQSEGEVWGEYVYTADFSFFTQTGTNFTLRSNSVSSYAFQIATNNWNDYLDEMTSFYRIQRAGVDTIDAIPSGYSNTVPSAKAYHEAAHLDDAYGPDGVTWYDLSGGWYDAGDYGQYGGNQWVAGEIALAYLRHVGSPVVAFDYDNNGVPDLLDEARVGAEYVMKYIDAFGGPLFRVRGHTSFLHPLDTDTTDNDPNTMVPNRFVERLDVGGSAKGAGMLAAVARAFDTAGLDAQFVLDATAAAEIAYNYALNNFHLDDGTYRSRFGIEDPLLWAEVELYKLTGDTDYLDDALDRIDELEPFTDVTNTNYWSLRPLALQEIYSHVDAPTQARIQELLKARVDYFMSMSDDTPYGVQNEFGNFGTNEQLATYMGDLVRYYEIFGDAEVLRAVKRGLYWIFGDNPWNISFVSGVGADHVDFPHTRLDTESYSQANAGIVIPGAMVAGPVLKDYLKLEVTNRPWYEDRPMWQDTIQQWRYNEYSVSIQAGLLYTITALAAMNDNPAGGTDPVPLHVTQPRFGDYVTGDVKVFVEPQGPMQNIAFSIGSNQYTTPGSPENGVYAAVMNVDSMVPHTSRRFFVRGTDANGATSYSAADYTVAPELPSPGTPLLYDGFNNDGLFGGQEINSWENWYNQDGGIGTYSELTVDGRQVGKFTQTPASAASRAKFQSWHDISDLSGYRYLSVTMKHTGYADARINIQIIDSQAHSVTGGYMSISDQWTTYQFDMDQFIGLDKENLKMAIWLRQMGGAYGEILIDDITATNVAGGTAPTLTAGGVNLASGHHEDDYTFQVTYTDVDDQAPYRVQLIIDGIVRDMAETDANDTDYTDGKTYSYTMKLPVGEHSYYFRTADTTSAVVETSPASGPDVHSANLALGMYAFGDSSIDAFHSGWNATDGYGRTMWRSSTGSGPHYLKVDLGSATTFSRVVVKHAGSGGEDASLNSVDFTVSTSMQVSNNWATKSTVTGNRSNVTVHEFAPVTARYVMVYVTDPTDTADQSAQIYEVEIYE